MDGILLVDKPYGITSNDLTVKVRKKLQEKVGHTGTLDFAATGLMILTVGKATKLTEYFQGLDKEYIAVGELGKITDTYDKEGKILEQRECKISKDQLIETIKSFQGTYPQYPPPFSSKRIKGKRAYQLAKKGVEVQLKPKIITVSKIDILSVDLPFFEIKVSCSSGTYIRTLIKEIGDKTSCGAYLFSLRRTRIDGYHIDEALPLESLLKMSVGQIKDMIIPLEKSIRFLPKVILDEGFDKRFLYGQRFKVPFDKIGLVQVFGKGGDFLGIGEIDSQDILKPQKVFL
ncbi:MAG: tRNA pseudouridine(55) synthase TruB [Aquificae bacterium]|nr:tRNA pseudouridine(55) synthase TruB [Aquificota bacterium]